jgi:subtilisin-like proprotein convertase family protein
VVLHNRQGGRTVNLRQGYDAVVAPGLAAYAGKSAKGVWKLEVRDEARIDTGLIRKFGLELRIANGEPRRVAKKPARGRRK